MWTSGYDGDQDALMHGVTWGPRIFVSSGSTNFYDIRVLHCVLCTWLYLEECTDLGAMPRSDHHSILTLLATSVPERLGSSIFLGVQEQSETGVMSIWQCVCHSVVMQSVH